MKKTPRQKIDDAIQRAISERESVELSFTLREGIPKEIHDGHPSAIRKIREMGVVHGQHLFVIEPRDNKHNEQVDYRPVHNYGVECKLCGGNGFQNDAERERMPGCPMHLNCELPLGTEGRKLARKHEIAKRRTAGTSVKTSREVAGLTQGELAQKAGVSRSTVTMGEKHGTWGAKALAKIEAVLDDALAKVGTP